MQYSRLEQETIINFNEEEETARVYTFNRALQNRLARLAADRPDDCRVDPDERLSIDGAGAFIVPRKWIKVSPPRQISMTEETREKLRENVRKAQAARGIASVASI